MIVYGIKNCDSVKKALKFLNEHDISYDFHDLKKEPVTCNTVSKWLEKTEMKRLLNSRGTTYRTLKLKELDLDDEGKKEYLCSHNMLIKRPVIEFDDHLIVGFDLETYQGVFL